MTDFGTFGDLVILLVAAFLPAVVYLAWVRKTERYMTEAWGPLLTAFAYGAIVATIVAAILEALLVVLGTAFAKAVPAPEFTFLNGSSSLGALFLVLVIAPFIEEALKASGVTRAAAQIRVLADGPVFGASVGLGFGFFETFLYGLVLFLTNGLAPALELVLLRSISSVLLHGSSTGMFGYGFAKGRLLPQGSPAASYYLLAVGMHATFNFLASGGAVVQLLGFPQYSGYAAGVGLLVAILFALVAIEHVRSLIRQSDFPGAQGVNPRFRPPPIQPRTVAPPGRR